ncbi:hypothetical protein CKAH01_18932 [Colletotrichum kahawae]|uniref:Uncharacterized protein n=1 Tax=Colletotrichum kahawae TaxID=34407 RepID=A0AAE0D158_COLKA|nr:hypothetical protein CKAH01_18932 [Colletotrichum kahawae]
MSPFLTVSAPTDVPRAPPWDPQLPEVPKTPSQFTITTPTKSADLQRYRSMWEGRRRGEEWDHVARTLVFTKAGKTIDNNNMKISILQQEVARLQALVDRYKPLRRAKVKPKPNERFVMIPQVMEAKRKAMEAAKREAARPVTLSINHLISEEDQAAQFASWCFEFRFEGLL